MNKRIHTHNKYSHTPHTLYAHEYTLVHACHIRHTHIHIKWTYRDIKNERVDRVNSCYNATDSVVPKL